MERSAPSTPRRPACRGMQKTVQRRAKRTRWVCFLHGRVDGTSAERNLRHLIWRKAACLRERKTEV